MAFDEQHIQHDLAYRVYGRMDPETDRSKIDIWTIIMIAKVIIQIVQAIQHCREDKDGIVRTVKKSFYCSRGYATRSCMKGNGIL